MNEKEKKGYPHTIMGQHCRIKRINVGPDSSDIDFDAEYEFPTQAIEVMSRDPFGALMTGLVEGLREGVPINVIEKGDLRTALLSIVSSPDCEKRLKIGRLTKIKGELEQV